MRTESKDKRTQSQNEPILLSAADCARMCGIGRRSWFRYVAGGKTPACIRLNTNPKWHREDIELWISMGCPDRKTFEAMKHQEAE